MLKLSPVWAHKKIKIGYSKKKIKIKINAIMTAIVGDGFSSMLPMKLLETAVLLGPLTHCQGGIAVCGLYKR